MICLSKPTLGFPSQKLAILALAEKGCDPHDIAGQVGAHVNTVRARLLEASRKASQSGHSASASVASPRKVARHNLARPVIGHGSVREAVLALSADGHAPAVIADRVGSSLNAVAVIRCRAGVAHRAKSPPPQTPPEELASLNYDVMRELRPFAAKRGTTVKQIAREIVEAALERGLVDQLLAGRF